MRREGERKVGHEIGLFLRYDETHKVKFLVEMFGSPLFVLISLNTSDLT